MLNQITDKFFFQKDSLPSNIDLHSHLIPEIDDGCDSIEESIKIILQMKKLGYKKLIITPHVMLKRYPNTIQIIKQGLFELRSILKVKNINIEIEAAAEYYCDNHFLSLIKKNDLLSFGKNYILFEFPYTKLPNCFEEVVYKLLEFGYKPVLAHPERYTFMTEVREYRRIKSLGVLFQVNVNSLGGYYGKEVQRKSLMLAQKAMVDFIGSDIHHQKHMTDYKQNISSNHLEMLFNNNTILNDTI